MIASWEEGRPCTSAILQLLSVCASLANVLKTHQIGINWYFSFPLVYPLGQIFIYSLTKRETEGLGHLGLYC